MRSRGVITSALQDFMRTEVTASTEWVLKICSRDIPGAPVVKTLPSNAAGVGSIPAGGSRVPHASGPRSQNRKQKQYCNEFNKRL